MLEAFRRDGGLIVEGMFDRATIDAMTAAADWRVPEFPPGSATQGMGAAGAAFVGANTVRFSSLPLLDDAYLDMLDNEIYAAIADADYRQAPSFILVTSNDILFYDIRYT